MDLWLKLDLDELRARFVSWHGSPEYGWSAEAWREYRAEQARIETQHKQGRDAA